jgi:hypothetical protein
MADTAKPKPRGRASKPNRGPLPTKPIQRRATKWPWDKVLDHYVTAESLVTHQELADVYGIPIQTIRSKAAVERWAYVRASHQSQNTIARREARTAHLAKESVGFDDQSLKAAKLGQTLILGRLGQIAQQFQAEGVNFEEALKAIRSKQPFDRYALKSSINYNELIQLANALDRFQTVGRKAMGTDVENISIQNIIDGTATLEVNVHDEMQKPDLDRMAGTIMAMKRAGLGSLLDNQLAIESGDGTSEEEDSEAKDIIDAEIVESATPPVQ